MIRFTLAASLVFVIAQHARAQTMLELVPQDVAAAVSIRHLDELIEKGNKFIREAEIRNTLRPSELFDLGVGFLGVRAGFDRKRPASIVLMSPEKDQKSGDYAWLENNLVPILPFNDADMMGGNFGIDMGKFLPKEIQRSNRKDAPFVKFVDRKKDHVLLSGSDKTLRRIQKSKPAIEFFSPAQRKVLDEGDILINLGKYLWQMDEFSLAKELASKIRTGDDPQEKLLAGLLAESIKDVDHAAIGLRLEDGVEGHFIMTVPKASKATKLLSLVRDTQRSSSLQGLPEGNVLFAQAAASKSGPQKVVAKMLFNFLLEDLLIQNRLVANTDRFQFLGLFNEVWSQLDGNRLAIYQNTDEGKTGLFSAVAILDVEDAVGFLRDMKTLAKMATAESLDWTKAEVKQEIDIARVVKDLGSSAYKVRNSADIKLVLIGEPALPYLQKAIDSKELDLETLRRCQNLLDQIGAVAAQRRKELLKGADQPLFLRPKFTFVSNAEKRAGQDVDVVHIKIQGEEKAAAYQTATYKQILGPDWDKLRLAVVGKHIVAMLGSDATLFDATVRNVQKNQPGLAGSKALAGFHQRSAKDRMFELHVSVEGILRLTTPMARLDTKAQLTSLGLSLGETSVQLDAHVPSPEVRAIAKKTQEVVQ